MRWKNLGQVEGLHILGPLDPEIRGGAVTFTLWAISTRMIWRVC